MKTVRGFWQSVNNSSTSIRLLVVSIRGVVSIVLCCVNLLASYVEPLERESCLLAINPLIFTLNALLKKFQRKHFFVGL